MGSYEEVWKRFVSERKLEFGGHTDPNWQEGHALSASFIAPVEVSRFRERLDVLRDALRPFPFVSLHPDHFLHITLLLVGFPVQNPRRARELSYPQLEEFAEMARDALSGFSAFDVRLANLNAFPGAAFVEAHDSGMLERLQDTLCQSCGLKRPPGPPHLTLAYFHIPDGSPAPQALVSTIESYRDFPVGEFKAERVELTLLDLREEYPKPEPVAKIKLADAVADE